MITVSKQFINRNVYNNICINAYLWTYALDLKIWLHEQNLQTERIIVRTATELFDIVFKKECYETLFRLKYSCDLH